MTIPFRLTIISLDPELSDNHIRSALTVRLVRSTFLTIAKQRVQIQRVVATGAIWKVENTLGDGTQLWEVTGSLVGVKPGGEVSWALSGFIEVRVSTRSIFLAVRENLIIFLFDQVFGKDDAQLDWGFTGILLRGNCSDGDGRSH